MIEDIKFYLNKLNHMTEELEVAQEATEEATATEEVTEEAAAE